MPLVTFLVSPCYLQDAMPCQWSSSDLSRVLRICIFYLILLPGGLRLPWDPAVQPRKLARLHADLRNIAPA